MSFVHCTHARLCTHLQWCVAVITVFATVACNDGRLAAPRPHGTIAIASGNAQRGAPGHPLAQPIVVVVRDASGVPVSGVALAWSVDDGGSIDPPQSVTDVAGRGSASWTLGAGPGPHRAHATTSAYATVEMVASVLPDPPFDVLEPLSLGTYDGSGQTVHPDYVETTGGGWTHASSYLFITPYPNGNATFENPSLYETTDFVNWSSPLGLTNPIVTPKAGYYSDPDAVYVPAANELWLYFREVTDANVIRLTTSPDGVQWSAPVVVARAPNHEIISPTVVRRGPADWLMWAVNGNVGCTGPSATVELRRSSNGLDWSKPEAVSLSQAGVFPWHIDVEWIPSRREFWALFSGKTAGSCTTAAVYLATSGDGVRWKTYPSPVLARGATKALQDVVYRSTFAYDAIADAVTIWYSGARYDGVNYVWGSAVQRRLRADLFSTIQAAASRPTLSSTIALPPLRNFP